MPTRLVSPYVAVRAAPLAATALAPPGVRSWICSPSSTASGGIPAQLRMGALLWRPQQNAAARTKNPKPLAGTVEAGAAAPAPLVLGRSHPAPKSGNPLQLRGCPPTTGRVELIARPRAVRCASPRQMLRVVMGSQEQLGSFIAILGKALVAVRGNWRAELGVRADGIRSRSAPVLRHRCPLTQPFHCRVRPPGHRGEPMASGRAIALALAATALRW